MALARIISHSHEHCRELAVDLLARGYVVEIVSPDKIPDNFADLELRVDVDMANALTAKVAARTGQHSSFFDFVHHLDAPIGDFVRRPPKPKFESIANLTPVSFNGEPNVAAELEIPTESENPKPVAAPVIESPVENRKTTASPKVERPTPREIPIVPLVPPPGSVTSHADNGFPLVSGTEEVPTRPVRPRPKRGVTIILHRPRPEPKIKIKNSKQGGGSWFLQVTAGFALIVALSAIPIVGVRGGDPLVPSASADTQKIILPAAASHDTPTSNRATTASAKGASNPQDRGKERSSLSRTSKSGSSQVPMAEHSTDNTKDLASGPVLVQRHKPITKADSRLHPGKTRHAPKDDSVAQDTVTYLDRGVSYKNH